MKLSTEFFTNSQMMINGLYCIMTSNAAWKNVFSRDFALVLCYVILQNTQLLIHLLLRFNQLCTSFFNIYQEQWVPNFTNRNPTSFLIAVTPFSPSVKIQLLLSCDSDVDFTRCEVVTTNVKAVINMESSVRLNTSC